MTIAEFLAIRETSLPARFMRQTLDPTQWEEFTRALSEEFYGAFKDPIEVARDVWIATGIRP